MLSPAPSKLEQLAPADVNVLLVDDERLSRLVVSNMLRKCGYKCTQATSGEEALALLQERPADFHLLLTDVMMPGVDGIQLLRHVRECEELGAMPVIMMSANEHSDTVFSCIQNGAEDYLLKPVTKKELQNIWQHVWRRRKTPLEPRPASIAGAEEGAQEPTDAIPVPDTGPALARTRSKVEAGQGPMSPPREAVLSLIGDDRERAAKRQRLDGTGGKAAAVAAEAGGANGVDASGGHGGGGGRAQPEPQRLEQQAEQQQERAEQLQPDRRQQRQLATSDEGSWEHESFDELLASTLRAARALHRPGELARPLPHAAARDGDDGDAPCVTLRDVILSDDAMLDKVDRLHAFRNVVELVREAHKRGAILGCVRPSLLRVFPNGRVSFLNPTPSSPRPSSFTEGARAQQLQRDGAGPAGSQLQPQQATDAPMGRQPAVLARAQPSEADGLREARLPMEQRTLSSREQALPPLGYGDALCRPVNGGAASSGGSQRMRAQRRNLGSGMSEEDWYRAPEVANGEEPSPAADVYALGVLFFDLMAAHRSLEQREQLLADLRMRILPPELLEDRPREATFILRLLHPDPDARPTVDMTGSDAVLEEAKEALAQRGALLEIDEHALLHELCLDFLEQQQEAKRARARRLAEEVKQIDADILEVERRFSKLGTAPNLPTLEEVRKQPVGHESYSMGNSMLRNSLAAGQGLGQLQEAFFRVRRAALGKNAQNARAAKGASTSAWPQAAGAAAPAAGLGSLILDRPVDHLPTFAEDLTKFVKYSRLEVGPTLKHGGVMNSANMVCSLGFDRDEEYFATAGVCKKIKVFEFGSIMERPGVGMNFPVVEMSSQSKLSSIAWNPYVKNHLASSDYDGMVHIWDVSTQKPTKAYDEHSKRVWSVGFSPADPMRLISGSDDGLVKVWSMLQDSSVMTINSHANVCCVQFNPLDPHQIAFGSADYKLYYYDLRKPSVPLFVMAGHNKAVSYVSFVDGQRVVSASTDNTLKLWDINRGGLTSNAGNQIECERTFTGHINEKNFVGLSVNKEGYIACGSEDNNVYVYFRALPTPLGSAHFHGTDPIVGQDTADEAGQFVSAVCWRQRDNVLLAANSLGNIRALRLG